MQCSGVQDLGVKGSEVRVLGCRVHVFRNWRCRIWKVHGLKVKGFGAEGLGEQDMVVQVLGGKNSGMQVLGVHSNPSTPALHPKSCPTNPVPQNLSLQTLHPYSKVWADRILRCRVCGRRVLGEGFGGERFVGVGFGGAGVWCAGFEGARLGGQIWGCSERD